MDILVKYFIPPYKIKIIRDQQNKQYYIYEIVFDSSKYNSLTKLIEKQILTDQGFLDAEILKFNQILDYLKQIIDESLNNCFENNPKKSFKFIRDWIIYKIIGLEQLMPLLLDDLVQEIYMDKPKTPLYLDHQNYGRCLTKIIVTDDELDRLRTRLCLEKDAVLNYLNPSLKVELKTEKFHVRAALDIPPLANDGMSMNIRKLRKKIWTIPELIKENMLTIEAAAYLLFVLKRRFNFTIIGEPSSGKTTLANAIDLLTPVQWRKITIEDVIESVEQTQFNKFQTRYSVSPFESKLGNHSKSEEIIKLLHRSPSWIFLGEIQTAEHSRALFEALSAGLVGIQTCHGRSTEMMILRWINQHNIPLSSLLTLDILIETIFSYQNWKIKRNVMRIVEISKAPLINNRILNTLNDLELVEIVRYNLNTSKLVKKIDLFETPVLSYIKQRENITRKSFEEEMESIKNKLKYLIKNDNFKPNVVLDCLLSDNFNKKIRNTSN
ncbi:MAG: type II/IV secretion system ATPase subunit [Asgard group archaeon]|nr:type II/IV secretion system ATPase subunit [Asgard group archaeon]